MRILRARPGFLLIESTIGFALFGIFLAAVGVALLASYQSRLGAGDRVRGVALTEAVLEATKSIRDTDFAELTAGDHGVRIGSGALGVRWIFDGAQTQTQGGYATRVTLSPLGTGWMQVQARTTWNRGLEQSGSVLLMAELTDWRTAKNPGNWSAPSMEGQYIDGGTPLFNSVVRSGDYVFVSSDISGGGRGLYVFDINNPTSPQRVAGAFDLAASAYDMVIKGTMLYLATGDPSSEIQAYDISSPATLSSGNRITTYDLPGSGRARSLALNGSTLLVGALEDAGQNELYSFDVSIPSSITLQHSINVDGSVLDIALRQQRNAYLASSEDVAELRVGDVKNPAQMIFPSGSGYNLTDVQDGLAMATSGTAALIGRGAGSAIEELVLFDVAKTAAPSPPPGPWYYDVGGTVNAVDIAPGARYAFLATAIGAKQLDIVDVRRLQWGQPPSVASMAVSSGLGRGILYDPWKDRVYLVTDTGFHIIKPL